MEAQKSSLHSFVAYVEDQPGVLNRVTSLFRRRCYNIVSLNVGRTHEPGVSRMTFVIEADDDQARRVEANLYKLVNVLSVEDITGKESVSHCLALIKVTVSAEKRTEVLQLVDVFRARTADVGDSTMIFEVSGEQANVDGMLKILSPYGVVEMVQTGTLVMTRGEKGAAAVAASTTQPPSLRGIVAA
jgi:acetolactate synthase-1/3 small subunit